jgi:hypothetical protein
MQAEPVEQKLKAVLVRKEGGQQIPVLVSNPPPAVFKFTRQTDANQIFVRQDNTSDPVIYLEGDRRRYRRISLQTGDRRKALP